MLVTKSCLILCDPRDCSPLPHQAPLSMEFSRQEYWSRWPFPSPGDLPGPGIKPRSSALQAGSLMSETPGKPQLTHSRCLIKFSENKEKKEEDFNWKIKWFFFSSVDLEIFKNLFVELIYSKIGFLWCVALSFHTHTHRFSYPPPQSGYKTISASLKTSRILCIRRRQWHPTPVLLPGKSHGQRSLVGCSPWGR